MLITAVLLFLLLAAAYLRSWTADDRDVGYRLWRSVRAPAAVPCQGGGDCAQ